MVILEIGCSLLVGFVIGVVFGGGNRAKLDREISCLKYEKELLKKDANIIANAYEETQKRKKM